MKRPVIFVIVIFFVTIVLILASLPKEFYALKTPKLPFINRSVELKNSIGDFSMININFGPLNIEKELTYRLGLDLQGGVRLAYNLDMSEIPENERNDAFDSARNIIERRVNFYGVSEPTIQTVRAGDEYRIVVELPGVTDVSQAIDLIGRTAQLSFWEKGEKDASESGKLETKYPFGMVQVLGGKEPIKTKLTGKDLEKATVIADPTTGETQVKLDFTTVGTKLFADITKRNVNKPVVIVLDEEIIQAPIVQQPIVDGNAVISGGFTQEAARNASISLNAGALPVPLKVVAQNNIGPSLGIASLSKSLFAGLIGLLSVMIFMITLYKKEGVLASIALFVYTVIILFVFKFIPITLTLAGIAGFILSIGMAVDANILIFERMKEEKRRGRPQDIAIEVGFERAWLSIRDSNFTSLLTCFILFYFGTGIIRGFALTLAIGILISMFSALFVTHNLLRVFDSKRS